MMINGKMKNFLIQAGYGSSHAKTVTNFLSPLFWLQLVWTTTKTLTRIPIPRFHVPDRRDSSTSSTAYLDGLRGVASFVVLIHHFSKDPFPWLPWGWGSERSHVPQYHFLQLPVVRIIHSGGSMVAVFFVVSGFAPILLASEIYQAARSGCSCLHAWLLRLSESDASLSPLLGHLPSSWSWLCSSVWHPFRSRDRVKRV